MKLLLILTSTIFLLLLQTFGYSQTYQIPGATQQPAWVFPLYFEEASGQRDTLYFAYDPNALQFGFDTIFGEKYVHVDTTKFNVSMSGSWYCGSNTLCDSALKVIVQKTIDAFGFQFINGLLPVKISWDVLLFKDSILPFPDQSPAPKLEGIFFHNAYSQDPDGWNCPPIAALTMTDTINYGSGYTDDFCARRDSAIIYWPGCTSCPIPFMDIDFRPWTGTFWVGIEENEKNKIKIYPNPFVSELNIFSSASIKEYEIITIEGKRIIKSFNPIEKNNLITIQCENLPPGIYFLKILTTQNQIYYEKVIKF